MNGYVDQLGESSVVRQTKDAPLWPWHPCIITPIQARIDDHRVAYAYTLNAWSHTGYLAGLPIKRIPEFIDLLSHLEVFGRNSSH